MVLEQREGEQKYESEKHGWRRWRERGGLRRRPGHSIHRNKGGSRLGAGEKRESSVVWGRATGLLGSGGQGRLASSRCG